MGKALWLSMILLRSELEQRIQELQGMRACAFAPSGGVSAIEDRRADFRSFLPLKVRELRAELEGLGLSTRGRVDREPGTQGPPWTRKPPSFRGGQGHGADELPFRRPVSEVPG